MLCLGVLLRGPPHSLVARTRARAAGKRLIECLPFLPAAIGLPHHLCFR